jgi:predicted small secreted protein
MTYKTIAIGIKCVLLCVLACFLLFSCQNTARWYPEAEASVSGSAEYIDQSGAIGIAQAGV